MLAKPLSRSPSLMDPSSSRMVLSRTRPLSGVDALRRKTSQISSSQPLPSPHRPFMGGDSPKSPRMGSQPLPVSYPTSVYTPDDRELASERGKTFWQAPRAYDISYIRLGDGKPTRPEDMIQPTSRPPQPLIRTDTEIWEPRATKPSRDLPPIAQREPIFETPQFTLPPEGGPPTSEDFFYLDRKPDRSHMANTKDIETVQWKKLMVEQAREGTYGLAPQLTVSTIMNSEYGDDEKTPKEPEVNPFLSQRSQNLARQDAFYGPDQFSQWLNSQQSGTGRTFRRTGSQSQLPPSLAASQASRDTQTQDSTEDLIPTPTLTPSGSYKFPEDYKPPGPDIFKKYMEYFSSNSRDNYLASVSSPCPLEEPFQLNPATALPALSSLSSLSSLTSLEDDDSEEEHDGSEGPRPKLSRKLSTLSIVEDGRRPGTPPIPPRAYDLRSGKSPRGSRSMNSSPSPRRSPRSRGKPRAATPLPQLEQRPSPSPAPLLPTPSIRLDSSCIADRLSTVTPFQRGPFLTTNTTNGAKKRAIEDVTEVEGQASKEALKARRSQEAEQRAKPRYKRARTAA